MTTLSQITEAVLSPALAIANPQQRLFWGYLLCALVLAGWVYWRQCKGMQQTASVKGFFAYVFAPKIWLSKSSAVDIVLMLCNALLRVVLFIPLIGSTFHVAFHTVTTLADIFGPLQRSNASLGTELITLYTLTLVLALDCSRYLLHRAMHRWPLLWRLHKWHHSAATMTPFTLYRIHPIESLLQYARDVLVTGFVTGCFFYACGRNVEVATVAGVNIARFAFNMLGANLRHSHIWLSFGPFEKLLISPAQHQIHHSCEPKHYDKNFGSQFALWDWLGGTLYLAKKYEKIRFGLNKNKANENKVRTNKSSN